MVAGPENVRFVERTDGSALQDRKIRNGREWQHSRVEVRRDDLLLARGQPRSWGPSARRWASDQRRRYSGWTLGSSLSASSAGRETSSMTLNVGRVNELAVRSRQAGSDLQLDQLFERDDAINTGRDC